MTKFRNAFMSVFWILYISRRITGAIGRLHFVIQKREKFILQGNLQGLGKKCSILTAVYLLIAGYLVGAASAGKRNDSTFAGTYKIRINNAVICGKLDVFCGTITVTNSSQISLADVGNIQYQR